MQKLSTYTLLLFLTMCCNALQAQSRIIQLSPDIALHQLTEHAWVHISWDTAPGFGRFSSNGLIILNKGKAILLDTPISEEHTRILVQGIHDSLQAKIKSFVPNHWHNDCMGGISYLKHLGVKTYAQRQTIATARAKGLDAPEKGFNRHLSLKLRKMKVHCYYPGPGHTPDNIVVWIPSEKILFAGCMVKDLHSQGLGNTADSDLTHWPATIKHLIERYADARYVIPGHGTWGDTQLLQHTKTLLEQTP